MEVSEELSSMEIRYKSESHSGEHGRFQKNLVVWKCSSERKLESQIPRFQKNLVVWKFPMRKREIEYADAVSEELSSMEIRGNFGLPVIIPRVSEELSSMEMGLRLLHEHIHITVSEELSSMEIVYINVSFSTTHEYRFRRT